MSIFSRRRLNGASIEPPDACVQRSRTEVLLAEDNVESLRAIDNDRLAELADNVRSNLSKVIVEV